MSPKTLTLVLAFAIACGVASATTSTDDYCLSHEENTPFMAADGCNTCICTNQVAVCTEAACVDPAPAPEPHEIQCLMTQRPISAVPYVAFCAASADASLESSLLPETVGCVDINANCIMAEQYAMGPDGRVFHFTSCVPEGFVPVQVDCATVNGACTADQLPILATERQVFCSSEGQQAIQSVLGCRDKNTMCLSMVTFAKDAAGQEWAFADSCIPESFTQIDSQCNSISCPQDMQAIYGTPFAAYCFETPATSQVQVAVGCTQETVCTEMVTFAQSPSGEKYVFSNGCIPEGFQTFDGSCETASCLANQHVVKAIPFEATCTYDHVEPVSVGCMDNDLMCPQVIAYGQDSQGKVFVFPNGCIPSTFTLLTEQPTCQEASGCLADQRPLTAVRASSFCSVGAEAAIEIVGCVQANIMCASLPVFAVSPKGIVYYFPVGCVPMDYTVIDANCQDLVAGESCVANTHAVSAIPMTHYCRNPSNAPKIAVGCVEDGMICPQAVTFGKNVHGQVYVFPNGCLPEGFNVVQEECPAACPSGLAAVEATLASDFCWGKAPGSTSSNFIAGCVESNLNCLMMETYAREKGTGEVFVFQTSCVPSHYEIMESVHSCHDFACSSTNCVDSGRVCQERIVECFAPPCPPETYCAAIECTGHAPYESFGNQCGATCSCDEEGNPSCGECAANSSDDNGQDEEFDTVVIAAGSVGVAAASAAVFVGYRKYFRGQDRRFSFRSKPTYSTMQEDAA